MKMNTIKAKKLWTPEQNREVIDLYKHMHDLQASGEKFVKAPLVRALAEKQGRTKGSIEAKLMNISAVYDLIGLDWVKGYKPLKNFNHDLAKMVCSDHGYDYEK